MHIKNKIQFFIINLIFSIGIFANGNEEDLDKNSMNAPGNAEEAEKNVAKSATDYEGLVKFVEKVDASIHGQHGTSNEKMANVKELTIRCLKLAEECDFAVHAFCKNKIGKYYEPTHHIDGCISSLIWSKFQPKLSERIEFGHKNEQRILPSFYDVAHDSLQLLEWILLPKKDLLVNRMHSALNPALYKFNKGEVTKMDVLLEILLTLSTANLLQILEYYKEKFGKELLEEINNFDSNSLLWLGEKEAGKVALEILAKRVENLLQNKNKNNKQLKSSIENIVENIFANCKKQNELMNQEDNKMLEDAEIMEIFEKVKELLIKFEPNSSEMQKFSDNWLQHCAFASNHAFQDWRRQRHFDEIGRMLTVANLLTPDSKIAYLREKFETAIEREDFDELSWLIASRMHLDLKEMADYDFGKCLAARMEKFLKTNEKSKKNARIYKYYFGILNEIFKLKVTNNGKENQVDEKCEENEGFGVDTIGLMPGKLLKLMREKIEKNGGKKQKHIKDVMGRHKEVSLPWQRKMLTFFGRILRSSIEPWCMQSKTQWWEFWKQTGKNNNRREQKAVDAMEQELAGDFCRILDEKHMDQKQQKDWENPSTVIACFLEILNSLKANPAKLKKFNSLLSSREWPKVQSVVQTFLNFLNIYAAMENSFLVKILLKFVNPSRAGQLEVRDIEALTGWYSEHFHQKIMQNDNDLGTEVNKNARRRKRFIIIIFPTTSMFLAYLQTCIIFLLIFAAITCPLGCIFSSGDLVSACVLALVRAIFYLLYFFLIAALSGGRNN